jgi:hypothetical protein
MSTIPELLYGPYEPPPLHRGDRAICFFRDNEVVITSWTDAPISWPRCHALGRRGGSGLLITEEPVRAIRSESSSAIQYWFGVTSTTVWHWRKACGVTCWGTEGSRRLHQAVIETAKLRGTKVTRGLVERRLATRETNATLCLPDR